MVKKNLQKPCAIDTLAPQPSIQSVPVTRYINPEVESETAFEDGKFKLWVNFKTELEKKVSLYYKGQTKGGQGGLLQFMNSPLVHNFLLMF